MEECPYCGVKFSLDGVSADYSFPRFARFNPYGGSPPDPDDKTFRITSHKCPECRRQTMWLSEVRVDPGDGSVGRLEDENTTLLYPKFAHRRLPAGVPQHLATDFREACSILETSPKASAAMSRRVLQSLIREQEGISKPSLLQEIAELLRRNKLPTYLAADLDAIRQVGNFAAHPAKDTNTGQIVDVEVGEAEWTLEIAEELVRFYFERQPTSTARRDALNKKLLAAGKSPLLGP